jgi:protein SCO1/2
LSACRAAFLLCLLPLLLAAAPAGQQDLDLGPVAPFTLTDRTGAAVTAADLQGQVWVAAFVLARCPDGKCPQVSQTVARLHNDLAGRKDVRFVSFVLDQKVATPEVLDKYAADLGADPERWLFLTGDKAQLDAVQHSFHVLVKGEPGQEVVPHSQRLFVVDRHGRVRGLYDGLPPFADSEGAERAEYERGLRRLKRRVDQLAQPELPAWMPKDFPAFNATLNALSGALVLLGYAAIRQRWTRAHAAMMLTAIAVSALFLTSYLFYHIYVKEGRPTRFSEQAPDAPAWVAYFYAFVLGSHTLLAVPVAPMAVWVAVQGLRGRLARHVRLARWTLPMWLYVSVTGVMVYWMLYRLYPL